MAIDEKAVFVDALALPGGKERDAYLQEACAGDPQLVGRLRELLAAHDGSQGPLDRRPPAPDATADPAPLEGPGTTLGAYKLLEQIGEGGFGAVYLAEQTQPVRRKVALKMLKPGMDTRQVVARFEAERQALALMDHSNIAKVHDGGSTPSGRPYFVMELVKGVPITEFCDQHRLAPRQRLELFVPVCQAVQHAHHKGIIHRDLKPSNVLVSLHDTTPVVKIIDFGVAKALGQELTDKTVFTGLAQMIGTPLYMSPEQAGLSDLDVDTRSDVYSLGVLLYELLTGTTPFDKERLKKVGYDELRRIIREEEPPRPSTRISTLGQAATTVSANRKADPRQLSRLCRGELDWIVMKCLEKDRNRRYETANGLAMDLQRYLVDEPVLARPPSAWYRLRKFARRNRRGLWTAALVAVILLAALGWVGWQAWDQEARQAKIQHEVETALRDAQVQEERVPMLADNSSECKAALDSALAALKPAQALVASHGDLLEPTLQEQVRALAARLAAADKDRALLAAAERIRLERSEPTLIRASRLASDMAARYRQAFADYGITAEVTPPLEVAHLLEAKHPAVRAALLSALDDWVLASTLAPDGGAPVRRWLGAVFALADPDGRRSQILAALKDRETLQALAQRPDALKQPLSAVLLLANALRDQGDNQTVLSLLRPMQRKHPSNFWVNWWLAHALVNSRPPQLEDGIGFFRVAVALRPRNPFVRHSLGYALQQKKAYAAALEAYETVLELKPDYVLTHSNIGSILMKKDDVPGAIARFKKAIECDPEFAQAYCNLGGALDEQGQYTEALKYLDKALAMTPKDALSHLNRGHVLNHLKKPDEALAAFKTAVACDPEFAEACSALGAALADQGDFAAALAQHKKAVALDPDEPRYHYNYGRALFQSKDFAGAVNAFLKASQLKPDWPEAHYNLGTARIDHNDLDGAIVAFRRAIDLKPNFAEAYGNLGFALGRTGDTAAAMKAFQKAIDLDPNLPLAEVHFNVGNARKDKGEWAGAIAAYKRAIELNDQFAAAYNNLGLVFRSQNDWKGAAEAYKKAVASDPNLAAAHSNLGAALVHLDQPAEGERHLRIALKLQPHYPEAQSNLGLALNKQNKFKDAEDAYRKAMEMGLDDYIVRFGLGRALLGQGKNAEAEKEFRQAVTWEPNLVVGHLLLGDSLAKQKKLDDAIAAYRQVLKLQPNLARAKKNLAATLNQKVWPMVAASDVAPADPNIAVELAKEAVTLDPEGKILWNTLGVAHYRVSAWKDAALALQKSVEINKGGLVEDWFFLAMTKWQLGEKEEALKWYDRAVKWMEKNPATEELRGFRAEAAKLLGADNKKDLESRVKQKKQSQPTLDS
jgi:tetratricopeptide (TPR) repeat protein/serine/threonine protein kinase